VRAALLEELGRLTMAELPDPDCGPGDVIIEVRCVQPSVTECMLIAGDDVAFHDLLARQLAAGPVAFGGHEFSGVVRRLGDAVHGVQVGDRVTAVESSPCGGCAACLRARPEHCALPSVIGFNRPGAFAELVAVPAASVVRLPETVSFSAGAALQPLAGAVHAHAALAVQPGESVLVIGGGVMGLLGASVARLGNASTIVVATRSEQKRALALEFGADEAVPADEVPDVVERVTDGLGFDVVVETAGGSPSVGLAGTSTMDTAVEAVRRGGRVAVVSVLPNRCELPAGLLRQKAVTLVHPLSGAGYYASTTRVFDHCAHLVGSGRIDVELLVTHRLAGIDALPEALEITADKARYGAINPAQVFPS
jgi:threonine dehydrogenase-like Zn-dependent dehydrogenase